MNLFRTKSLDRILADVDEPEHRMKRALGPIELIALGIGAIVGAGIFAVIGSAAAGGASHDGAGPALVISILITAIGCGFCALCYAEFASLVPISGSAYTYSYATLGELVAWIIGWDLIIEYAMGNVAVAVSWSGYFCELLKGFGIAFPAWTTTDLVTATKTPGFLAAAPHVFGIPIVVNIPAAAITLLLTWLLVIGIKESARFNTAMVFLKLVILVFFIVVGAFYVKPANWHPFSPNGWTGIGTGAALIFFAYIGFDAVSTAAEECRNPQKDMPIGMIGSLAICTVLYVATALVLTGMVSLDKIRGSSEPLAKAFSLLGMNWAAGIVAFGAVIATTAVLLVFQYGQARIFFSMARDGLLPTSFYKIHPRYKTPHVTTIWIGVVVAVLSAFANLDVFVELTNIGTLFAFILVCIGIVILRKKDPHRRRAFRTPLVPLTPILGVLICVYLMLGVPVFHASPGSLLGFNVVRYGGLPTPTWIRFGVWLVIGLAIYFAYGYRRSRLGGGGSAAPSAGV
jgi:basic amino acid/polyamine antiporter, APA family